MRQGRHGATFYLKRLIMLTRRQITNAKVLSSTIFSCFPHFILVYLSKPKERKALIDLSSETLSSFLFEKLFLIIIVLPFNLSSNHIERFRKKKEAHWCSQVNQLDFQGQRIFVKFSIPKKKPTAAMQRQRSYRFARHA